MKTDMRKHLIAACVSVLFALACTGCSDNQAVNPAPESPKESETGKEAAATEAMSESLITEEETEEAVIPLTVDLLEKTWLDMQEQYGSRALLPMTSECLASLDAALDEEGDVMPVVADYPTPPISLTMDVLRAQVNRMVKTYDGNWSVGYCNLKTGDEMILNDAGMPSASVMKLFVSAAVYDAIAQGKLERTTELVGTIADTLRYSSNEAANRLIIAMGGGDFAAGVDAVNSYLEESHYSGETRLYNGFQNDSLILDPDHHNQVAAADCFHLLKQVYHRTFASRKVCNEIEEFMLGQDTRYKIPAGLPEGTSVGNKSGETDSIENDVAVIYGGSSDYILCVFSNGWGDKKTAQDQIVRISREVYSFLNDENYLGKRFHPMLQSMERVARVPLLHEEEQASSQEPEEEAIEEYFYW